MDSNEERIKRNGTLEGHNITHTQKIIITGPYQETQKVSYHSTTSVLFALSLNKIKYIGQHGRLV